MPQRLGLRALREAVQACRGCELHRDATQAVMGDGRVSADGPGADRERDRAALVADLLVAAAALAASAPTARQENST